MDRAGLRADTDIMVLVQPEASRLLWIPRDLWCEGIQDRINAAYRKGGHPLLASSLSEHGLEARTSLCLSRTALEYALEAVSVTVPVPVRMEFSYPLAPTARIEDGMQRVVFQPPGERLRGERVHQWIGARGPSDLHRIERQKILLRRLLHTGFEFTRAIQDPREFLCSNPGAISVLAEVNAHWRFETLTDCFPRTIGNKMVLVRYRQP